MDCWNKYWQWTKTDEFKREMKKLVLADDFLDNNYLSNDARIPVTLLETNACSTLATNAIENNIWDNFSSRSYKDLPSVGTITVHHPITGEARPYKMPAGGARLYACALLSSACGPPHRICSTTASANSIQVQACDARMRSFQNSIEQMLWPEKRDKDRVLGDKVPGVIDRTTTTSYLRVPKGFLPEFLQDVIELEEHILPDVTVLPPLFKETGVEIGPIPTGTPVNLSSQSEHDARRRQLH